MRRIRLENPCSVAIDDPLEVSPKLHEHKQKGVTSDAMYDVEISFPSTFQLPPECVTAHLVLGQYLADEPATTLAGMLTDKSRRDMAKSFQGAFSDVIGMVEAAFLVSPNITPGQLLADLERVQSESKAEFAKMDVDMGYFAYRTKWATGRDLGFESAITLLRQIAQSPEPIDFLSVVRG